MDAVTNKKLVRNIEMVAPNNADIKGVTRVRARQVDSLALVNMEVEVPPDLSASCMWTIKECIRIRILSEVEGILDVWAIEERICIRIVSEVEGILDVWVIEESICIRIVSEVEGILDVEVKVTEEDAVFYPLLAAIEDSDVEHHISATEVEEGEGLLDVHPDVRLVESITVHYQDTILVWVDANICVDPQVTASHANMLEVTLQKNVEELDCIDQDNIVFGT